MNERLVENTVGTLFTTHGFPEVVDIGAAIERDASTTVILRSRAVQRLSQLNPHLPDSMIDAVVASLSRPPHPNLIETKEITPRRKSRFTTHSPRTDRRKK